MKGCLVPRIIISFRHRPITVWTRRRRQIIKCAVYIKGANHTPAQFRVCRHFFRPRINYSSRDRLNHTHRFIFISSWDSSHEDSRFQKWKASYLCVNNVSKNKISLSFFAYFLFLKMRVVCAEFLFGLLLLLFFFELAVSIE